MKIEILKQIKNLKENEPLSKHTQIKIGGPAEYFVEVKNKPELVEVLKIAREAEAHVTILGWGSNVLVSDYGIKGLTIINKTNDIRILDHEEGQKEIELVETEEQVVARLDQLQPDIYGKFDDLDYDEKHLPTSRVYMDSGVSLPLAIYKTIQADLTGLQWFAGIPGTIGGAVYNNIHGGSHFFFEYVDEVEIMNRITLETRILKRSELGGDYDKSIFHETNDYIISVVLKLYHGDSQKAMNVMTEWRKRKKIQPQISSGCVWQNLSDEQKSKLNLPSSSAGYLIEHILKLKGISKGDAMISDKHAAFIENKGKAKASDVIYLMDLIRSEAKEKVGIELIPEIFLLGF